MVPWLRKLKSWFDDRFCEHPYAWGWSFAFGSGILLGMREIFALGIVGHFAALSSPEMLVYHFGLPFILGASAARHGKKLRELRARNKAESALALSEAKYRTLVSNIPGLVYRKHIREHGRLEFFNETLLERLTGFHTAQLAAVSEGIFPPGIMAGEDLERVEKTIRQARACAGPFELSYTIYHRDGSGRHLLDRGRVVADDAGPAYIDGVMLDITERRQMQLALQQERDFAEQLIDTAPVMILVLDALGDVLRFNKYIEEFTGYTQEEIKGRDPVEFIDPSERERVLALFKKTPENDLQTGEVVTGILTRSGHRREVAWRIRRLAGLPETAAGFLVIGQDITEQHVLEEQLRQSDKLRALGQLAGGIAHDFNNQLSGIIGYADLLIERITEAPRLKKYAEHISVAARRASELTGKLLAFARKGKYLTVPVNVNRTILEALALLESGIDRRISLIKSLHASPAMIIGDPIQLQNAFLNLGLNARDAIHSVGTITFETDICVIGRDYCEHSPFEIEPGTFIQVRVTDTGTGMSDDILSRIFEPFFTTKPSGEGTGMGLAAVYGTIKGHHGAIDVVSSSGNGSSFTILLPAAHVKDDSDVWNEQAAPVTGSGRILLVDDEDVVRGVTAEILSGLGYTIEQCRTGLEAVWYYREHWQQIDLVILDLVMPEMSGREAFPAILEVNKNATVLIASGYSVEGDAQEMLNLGARGFIQKPFRKSELSRKVAEVLANRAG